MFQALRNNSIRSHNSPDLARPVQGRSRFVRQGAAALRARRAVLAPRPAAADQLCGARRLVVARHGAQDEMLHQGAQCSVVYGDSIGDLVARNEEERVRRRPQRSSVNASSLMKAPRLSGRRRTAAPEAARFSMPDRFANGACTPVTRRPCATSLAQQCRARQPGNEASPRARPREIGLHSLAPLESAHEMPRRLNNWQNSPERNLPASSCGHTE